MLHAAELEFPLPGHRSRFPDPPPHAAAPNDPGPKMITISPDDPHSMSQLLQLLEKQLNKHIDDNGYA